MVKYIIFLQKPEAELFIQWINDCMNFPDSSGTETYGYPELICEYDEETGQFWQLGWGVEILDSILDCLTEQQKSDILILPANMNVCSVFTGSTL
jgi:hypothetical protein